MEFVLPVASAILLWWAGTGLLLVLNRLPRSTHRWSMLGCTVAMSVAFAALHGFRDDLSIAGTLAGFVCALAIWAWNEAGFLMGYITGPRPEALPPGAQGWDRFARATQTLLYHELALVASAAAILLIFQGGANSIAVWTFALLWVMRLSAKFNLFLGVPNTGDDYLPKHMAYLKSHFSRRAMNLLFPVSVTLATITAGWLIQLGLEAAPGTGDRFGLLLLATLAVLGVIEHWMLVLPIPFQSLWRIEQDPDPAPVVAGPHREAASSP